MCNRNGLWSTSSLPSGNGPKSSSGGRVWLGIGLARPVRGSIHDVFFSLWSMKNMRPFGATCIVQPAGSPASKLFATFELSLVDVSSLEPCLVWLVSELGRATFAALLSAVSTSSFCVIKTNTNYKQIIAITQKAWNGYYTDTTRIRTEKNSMKSCTILHKFPTKAITCRHTKGCPRVFPSNT